MYIEGLSQQRRGNRHCKASGPAVMTGLQDKRNALKRQFVHCRMDAVAAQLNVQQSGVNVVKADGVEDFIEVSERTDNGAPHIDQELAQKLGEQTIVFRDENPQSAERIYFVTVHVLRLQLSPDSFGRLPPLGRNEQPV
jgi:hypothetical protein